MFTNIMLVESFSFLTTMHTRIARCMPFGICLGPEEHQVKHERCRGLGRCSKQGEWYPGFQNRRNCGGDRKTEDYDKNLWNLMLRYSESQPQVKTKESLIQN